VKILENIFCFCHCLAPDRKKEPHDCSITPPPTWWGGEENRKKKVNLMDWDKDSLTEQQRKTTVTTIVVIKRVYKARNIQCNLLIARWPAQSEQQLPSPSQLPPLIPEHDVTWY